MPFAPKTTMDDNYEGPSRESENTPPTPPASTPQP